ncbi:sulfite dehydrogenase [Sulfurimonas sp. HSL-1716]|uniref:sulfite dehydrogenase n=1 Tax=Hydrocurvibacter sulfurireducens TaxID=3131937 RepID=UPI0031F7A01F
MKDINSQENQESLSNDMQHTLDRRDFFRKSAALSATALAGTSIFAGTKALADDPAIINDVPWGIKFGDPVTKNRYGMPSEYEHNNIRRNTKLLSSGNWYASIAMCPIHESEGIITPNGLFFSRAHGGVAHVDPNEFRLMIHGLVEKPLVLTLDQLKRYPSVSRIHFIECPANGGPEWRGPQFNSIQFAKGMMSCAQWTGVYIKTILEDLGLKPEAQWMLAEGSDNSEMGRTVPIDKVLDDAMIVWGQNGEALRPEQGYPVRLLLPGWEGNMCVKWLKRLEFSSEPFYCKEETAKYTALKPSGKAVQHFYANEVNSVITSPCPEKPWTDLKVGDLVEIEGLAWSGYGTITGVDITFDGCKNWTPAKLKGLVLPKAWTRFSFMYRYEGKPLVIGSRAMDDAGRMQPTIAQEVAYMGVESVYHRNSIATWEVTANGEVNNVQIRS